LDSWNIRSLALEPHHPQVLRSDDDTRAIAINLPAGDELQDHQTHERAYLLVAAGEVDIVQDAGTVAAGPGFVAHFDPGERRELRARTDARIVLILAPWPGEGHPSRHDD